MSLAVVLIIFIKAKTKTLAAVHRIVEEITFKN